MLKKFLIGFAVLLVLLVLVDAGLGLFRRPTVVVSGNGGGYGYDPGYAANDHFWQDMFLYHMIAGGDHGWYGSGYYGHGFYPGPVVVHQPTVIVHTPAPDVQPRSSWGWARPGDSRTFGSGSSSRTFGSGSSSRPYTAPSPSYSRPSSSWSSSSSSSAPSRSSSFGSSSSSSRSYGSSSLSSSSSRSFGGRR